MSRCRLPLHRRIILEFGSTPIPMASRTPRAELLNTNGFQAPLGGLGVIKNTWGIGGKSEQSVQFGIDLVDHLAEVVAVVREVIVVGFYDKQFSEFI